MKWSRTLRALASALSVTLAGCSILPGMGFDRSLPTQDSALEYQSAPLAQDGGPGSTPYVIQSITPELLTRLDRVREQRRSRGTNPDLDKEIATYAYRVKQGDVLSIVIWGDSIQTSTFQPSGGAQPTGSTGATGSASVAMNSSGNNSGAVGFKVNSGGDIYFPYVGRVAVGGATTEEIRVRLARLMGAFLKSPQITVDVAQFNSQKYELTGAVMKPGLYPVTDQPLKVSQAIALAGGVIQQLPNAAAIGGVITRPLGDLSRVHYVHDGKTTILNLRALYRDGDATQDRLVCAGDAIQVPDNAIEQVHVMGEVHAPGNYPLDTGELNLAQVLGDAGGLDLTSANASRIFVFRGTYQEPQIFWLDARSVDSMLLANRFELEPQDIVYVATAGLTSWDRIVSQILPTIESVYETKVLVSP